MNNDKSVWDIGDVAKKPDEKEQVKAEKVWCPLRLNHGTTHGEATAGALSPSWHMRTIMSGGTKKILSSNDTFVCIGELCAWWVQNNTWRSDSGCAIRVIAERLRLK